MEFLADDNSGRSLHSRSIELPQKGVKGVVEINGVRIKQTKNAGAQVGNFRKPPAKQS